MSNLAFDDLLVDLLTFSLNNFNFSIVNYLKLENLSFVSSKVQNL